MSLTGEWRHQVVSMFTPEMAGPEFDDRLGDRAGARSLPDQGMGDRVEAGDVVVYRRQVDVPAEWAASPSASAPGNPGTQVLVNGQRVEPLRTPFAPYGDITALVTPGSPATIALVTQFNRRVGIRRCRRAAPGPLGTRYVTEVLREVGIFATPDGDGQYTLVPARRHPRTAAHFAAHRQRLPRHGGDDHLGDVADKPGSAGYATGPSPRPPEPGRRAGRDRLSQAAGLRRFRTPLCLRSRPGRRQCPGRGGR